MSHLIGGDDLFIPEFVCGVGATLLAELIAAIIWTIRDNKKKKK